MPMRVDGKAIVITGGGSGIGRAFAQGLAREGAHVGVLDVNHDAAARVVEEIATAGGPPAMALKADVSRRAEVARALDTFVDRFGDLDVLFNNAGINTPMHLLD